PAIAVARSSTASVRIKAILLVLSYRNMAMTIIPTPDEKAQGSSPAGDRWMIGSVGIIGLGRFGNLLGNILSEDLPVTGFDSDLAKMREFTRAATLAEVAASDTIFFCVPISRLEGAVAEALPYLRQDAFVLDVCSVKVEPAEILARCLPAGVRILPTHPMFG